jgi:hypothetical protein
MNAKQMRCDGARAIHGIKGGCLLYSLKLLYCAPLSTRPLLDLA